MARLGVPFEIAEPEYTERDLGLAPTEESLGHARGKADSVAAQYEEAVVVGSDQLLFWSGRRHYKPESEAQAVKQLMELRGIEHYLYTSLVVMELPASHRLEDVTISKLVIRKDLREEEAHRYVRRDSPVGCAGGYRLESLGISLFREIDTPDYTAVLGLPLMALSRFLRVLGFRIP